MIIRVIKIIVASVLCLLLLCSCSFNAHTYSNTETIEVNYNNVNNYCRYWLTTDSICYLKDSLLQYYVVADKDSKRSIGMNGGLGMGNIQRYGDKIYMLNVTDNIGENNMESELKCYDVNSKKTEKICTVDNCEQFFVLDGSVYYLECTVGEYWTYELKRFSMSSDKHTTIADNIVSFGVIDNCVYYVTEQGGVMEIMRYDAEGKSDIKCGELAIDGISAKRNDILMASVSYTKDHIFFLTVDSDTELTTVWKYSFEGNSLSSKSFEGRIEEFVSHDANSYFILSSDNSDTCYLYKLDNATDEATEIAEFQDIVSLFVGSDRGAYVLRNDDLKVVFYSNEGKAQVVYEC